MLFQRKWSTWLGVGIGILLLTRQASASLGDRLPDFRECVKVGQTTIPDSGEVTDATSFVSLRIAGVGKESYVSRDGAR